MADHVDKVEKSSHTNRTLEEKDIKDLFDTLKLGTAAEREKFLGLDQFSKAADLGQDRTNEILRVRFADSTASTPVLKQA